MIVSESHCVRSQPEIESAARDVGNAGFDVILHAELALLAGNLLEEFQIVRLREFDAVAACVWGVVGGVGERADRGG